MTVFLIVMTIILVILLLLLLIPLTYKLLLRKYFKYFVNRKLYALSKEEDYLLVNELILDLSDDVCLHIDHILCGDKFIYIVSDRYLFDAVEGSPEDDTFFLHKGKKRIECKNSLKLNRRRAYLLSKYLNWHEGDPRIVVPITVTNDKVKIDPNLKSMNGEEYIVHLKDLVKTIKQIEYDVSINVGAFDGKHLESLVAHIKELDKQDRKSVV